MQARAAWQIVCMHDGHRQGTLQCGHGRIENNGAVVGNFIGRGERERERERERKRGDRKEKKGEKIERERR